MWIMAKVRSHRTLFDVDIDANSVKQIDTFVHKCRYPTLLKVWYRVVSAKNGISATRLRMI